MSATDADSGRNSELSYKIISGNDRHDFMMNATTGVITVAKHLHYNNVTKYPKKYNMTVEVSDHGTPTKLYVTGMVSVYNVRPISLFNVTDNYLNVTMY